MFSAHTRALSRGSAMGTGGRLLSHNGAGSGSLSAPGRQGRSCRFYAPSQPLIDFIRRAYLTPTEQPPPLPDMGPEEVTALIAREAPPPTSPSSGRIGCRFSPPSLISIPARRRPLPCRRPDPREGSPAGLGGLRRARGAREVSTGVMLTGCQDVAPNPSGRRRSCNHAPSSTAA